MILTIAIVPYLAILLAILVTPADWTTKHYARIALVVGITITLALSI